MNDQEKARLYLERFAARHDVYGVKWSSVRADGTTVSQYSPRCLKLWSDGCGLKTGAFRCDTCEIKQYEQVSEETVLRHIRGENEQIQYMLFPDGTVRYAALDWDKKVGKEARGIEWPTVKAAADIMAGWGLTAANARSTSLGHHTYLFVTEPYPANKIRAILFEILERCGAMERYRLGEIAIPESFPKQSYTSNSGIGNGIKTPLILSPGISVGRNCFVDENGEMIGAGLPLDAAVEAQWAYFASVPAATPQQLDEIIAREGLTVYEDTVARGNGTSGAYGGMLKGGRRRGGWQPALNGSFDKLLEGCGALRRLRDRCDAGQIPTHDEGFLAFHAAMHTSDGIDYFRKGKIPGWGKTDKDIKQLEYSLNKNYSPPTCRLMQEKGLCKQGTVCFKKRPPIDTVEGQQVLRVDIPESEWPEPSPIRYAFSSGEDFLQKLTGEADALRGTMDPEKRVEMLKAIAYRAQVFDAEQQKELKTFIRGLKDGHGTKIIKAGQLSTIFNEAADKSNDELKEAITQGADVATVDKNMYRKLYPYGYGYVKAVRSKTLVTPFCSADLWINEIRSYVDDDSVARKVYIGKAAAPGAELRFEIDSDKWSDNTEFMKYFSRLLDTGFNVIKQDVDLIRQAVMAFSLRAGEMIRSQFLVTQGWYKDSYLMPSVVVDREGVKPNTEQRVDLSYKEYAKNLDFKLLADDEFKETLLHIKAELLNCWPRPWTTVGMAHAMLPVLVNHLHLKQKPTLFYEGLTGSGKTELTHMFQYFWGDFPQLLNLASTGKGIMDVGHDFKDALLVVDDFKGIDQHQIQAVRLVIQYAYDGNAAIKMRRDLTQHKPKGSRAVLMASGEHFVTSEASMVARCILIEVDKHDTRATGELHQRCEAMRKNYSGVTARYTHWFLNNNQGDLKQIFYDTKKMILGQIATRQNAARLSFNLALNHLSWALWVEFMLHNEVITHKEKEQYLAEHAGYLKELALSMANRCEEEQGGVIFSRVLKQLLDTGEVSVKGLDGYMHERKPVIGYAPQKDAQPGRIYLHPEPTWKAVMDYSRNISISGSPRSISKQLIELGVIEEGNKNRCTVQMRDGDERHRVWVVNMDKLGFGSEVKLRVVGGSDPLPFKPGEELKMDDEGIF